MTTTNKARKPEDLANVPLGMLRTFEQAATSNVWRILDEERARATMIRTWPTYNFADHATYLQAATRAFHTPSTEPLEVEFKAHALSVFGPWRITRGIYHFDPALSEALADSAPADEIPVEILLRLPEWSVCLVGDHLSSEPDVGCVFAAVTTPATPNDPPELKIIAVDHDFFVHFTNIELTAGTSVESSFAAGLEQVEMSGPLRTYATPPDQRARVVRSIARYVAHVLYLCANEPDMAATPIPPTPRKTKSGLRFFPPETGSRIVEVGARFGAMFRKTREAYAAAEASARTGRTMPPHWRKGHWNHYWLGPRKAEHRNQIIRWIAPTFINPTTDELPAVVRSVR